MGKPLIAGNWKMHGTAESALNLATQLSHQKFQENAVEIIVFPPLVHMSAVSDVLTNSNISLGAQNVSQYPNGAYTGEVSAEMLVDQGCKYVWLGTRSAEQYWARAIKQLLKNLEQHRMRD